MEFKVEKNVPLHESKTSCGRVPKYPFREMQAGDSFFVPATAANSREIRSKLTNASFAHGLRRQQKFTVRTVDGGYRVWRVA